MLALPVGARVMLTGATGFLGRHCLDRLTQAGAHVHAINRNGIGPAAAGIKWLAADLRRPEAAAAVVQMVRPTHLLHNAWIAVPGRFWHDDQNLAWLEGGIALLRAFRNCGGQRFVGVGTCAEYDWTAQTFSEDETPCRPATLYGRAKHATWTAAQAFADGTFAAAWARVFLPFGPGDNPARLVPSVIGSLRSGRPVALGTGAAVRDLIWAPDIADLLVRLLAEPHEGAFNVGTGHGTSVGDVARAIAMRLGRPDLLEFGARPDPVDEPGRLVADMRKARNLLGWKAPTALEAGLDVLLESG